MFFLKCAEVFLGKGGQEFYFDPLIVVNNK